MPAQPPLLTADPVTGRIYIVTEYDTRNGNVTAHDQTDVTQTFINLVTWWADTNRGPHNVGI